MLTVWRRMAELHVPRMLKAMPHAMTLNLNSVARTCFPLQPSLTIVAIMMHGYEFQFSFCKSAKSIKSRKLLCDEENCPWKSKQRHAWSNSQTSCWYVRWWEIVVWAIVTETGACCWELLAVVPWSWRHGVGERGAAKDTDEGVLDDECCRLCSLTNHYINWGQYIWSHFMALNNHA